MDLWYWSISLSVSLSLFTSLTYWARSWADTQTHTYHTHIVCVSLSLFGMEVMKYDTQHWTYLFVKNITVHLKGLFRGWGCGFSLMQGPPPPGPFCLWPPKVPWNVLVPLQVVSNKSFLREFCVTNHLFMLNSPNQLLAVDSDSTPRYERGGDKFSLGKKKQISKKNMLWSVFVCRWESVPFKYYESSVQIVKSYVFAASLWPTPRGFHSLVWWKCKVFINSHRPVAVEHEWCMSFSFLRLIKVVGGRDFLELSLESGLLPVTSWNHCDYTVKPGTYFHGVESDLQVTLVCSIVGVFD